MAEGLTAAMVQAAMKAMMDKAMEKPNEPIAMCIVDAAGSLRGSKCHESLPMPT